MGKYRKQVKKDLLKINDVKDDNKGSQITLVHHGQQ